MKVFITGILGFIGSHLARHHLEQGDEVWGIDNLSTGQRGLYLDGTRTWEADLLEWSELPKAVAWADAIYHMAATVGQKVVLKAPFQVLVNNIRGCERLLEVVASENKKCKLLIASSSEVYGHNKQSQFIEDEDLHFSSKDCVQGNYALSKLVNEKVAIAAVLEKDLDCVVVRLFNTTGVGQTGRYGMVVPRFIHQAMNNEPITIFGEGTQTRSFCDVRDTIIYLKELLYHPKTKGEIINVGNDQEISIYDLAHVVKKTIGSSSTLTYLSYKEAYDFDFQETARRCPNLEKMRSLVSYNHYFTLEETIKEIMKSSMIGGKQ
jgi:UDP-glucose 4-epimerase